MSKNKEPLSMVIDTIARKKADVLERQHERKQDALINHHEATLKKIKKRFW